MSTEESEREEVSSKNTGRASRKVVSVSPAGRSGRAQARSSKESAQVRELVAQIDGSRRKAESDFTEIERLKGETRALLSKMQAA